MSLSCSNTSKNNVSHLICCSATHEIQFVIRNNSFSNGSGFQMNSYNTNPNIRLLIVFYDIQFIVGHRKEINFFRSPSIRVERIVWAEKSIPIFF